ncbi:hypothetical protein VNO77_22803 [Canavalia gladiata]|uniref:Uncharacterized protein n=1 Tax=Canavalia gladiata TaxID=3824 RepID=A0AAN9QAX5_CANGL
MLAFSTSLESSLITHVPVDLGYSSRVHKLNEIHNNNRWWRVNSNALCIHGLFWLKGSDAFLREKGFDALIAKTLVFLKDVLKVVL